MNATAQLSDETWFLVLLVLSLGFIPLLYVLVGPASTQPMGDRPPSGAQPAASPGHA